MSGREGGKNNVDGFSSRQVSSPKACVVPNSGGRKKDTIVMFFAEFSGFLCSRAGREF